MSERNDLLASIANTIKDYCDKCAVLETGKLIIYDSVHDALQSYEQS